MNQQETFDTLNEQLKNIPKVQIRLMSLSVLPRLMGALNQNNKNCIDCKNHNQKGQVFVNDIQLLFKDNIKAQNEFEKWADTSQKHLKIKHGQHTKGRISATYATIGMAIGCLSTLPYLQFSGSTNYFGVITLGWAIGVLTGYTVGKIKERKLTQNNKLY